MRRCRSLGRRVWWHLFLLRVVLLASAASGQHKLATSALNFGSVQAGSSSTLSTPFTNTSRRQITISQASVSGPGFRFSGPSLPITLAPHESISLSVTFAPQATGSASGSLSIADSNFRERSTIFLSGAGTAMTSPPVITSSTAASGSMGSTFSYRITATNSPTSYAATGLPPGLAVSPTTGLISGTPTTAGASIVTVGATNSGGTASANLALTISSAVPVITSSPAASGTMGSAFSYQITATNSPTSYAATGLPPGLAVSPTTGLIWGTPTTAGTSIATVSATNSGGTASANLTLTITSAAPVITSSTAAGGTMGNAFSYQITATNSPTSYTATGLPPGLAVSPTTGLVSGTPATAGTSTVTVSATNSGGTGSANLTLTVSSAAPVITSLTAASGSMGSPFSYQITATNSPTSYTATGLPSGLAVSPTTGLISGTPATAGTSTVTVSATNSGGTGSANLTLTVSSAAPVITSSTAVSGAVGSAFSYQITATNSPTRYGATGLPPGLAVNANTGIISGTPTISGTSSITISATSAGGIGTAILTLSTASTSYSVTLSWNQSPSPDTAGNEILGYNIFRSTTSGGPYQQLNSTVIAGTTYADTTVADGTTYYYVATVVDSSNAQSGYSTQIVAVIP